MDEDLRVAPAAAAVSQRCGERPSCLHTLESQHASDSWRFVPALLHINKQRGAATSLKGAGSAQLHHNKLILNST